MPTNSSFEIARVPQTFVKDETKNSEGFSVRYFCGFRMIYDSIVSDRHTWDFRSRWIVFAIEITRAGPVANSNPGLKRIGEERLGLKKKMQRKNDKTRLRNHDQPSNDETKPPCTVTKHFEAFCRLIEKSRQEISNRACPLDWILRTFDRT